MLALHRRLYWCSHQRPKINTCTSSTLGNYHGHRLRSNDHILYQMSLGQPVHPRFSSWKTTSQHLWNSGRCFFTGRSPLQSPKSVNAMTESQSTDPNHRKSPAGRIVSLPTTRLTSMRDYLFVPALRCIYYLFVQ